MTESAVIKEKRSGRGGKRAGSGRKKTGRVTITIRIEPVLHGLIKMEAASHDWTVSDWMTVVAKLALLHGVKPWHHCSWSPKEIKDSKTLPDVN